MKAKILRRMMMVMVLLGVLVGALSAGVFAEDTEKTDPNETDITWMLDDDGVLKTPAGVKNIEKSAFFWLPQANH